MPAPPPPPPPPPPMPGAAGGPPPPPPPPPASLPSRPDAKQTKGRGALLGDIEKGARLKKVTQVNDRSAPIIDNKSSSNSGPPVGGAPPVPTAPGLRPPAPPNANRARSNSDQGSGSAAAVSTDSAPQLGGLFAGGIPKLRKSAGGVNLYDSDPETPSRPKSSAPTTPPAAPPAAPNGAAPKPPGLAPPPLPPPTGSAPVVPSLAALRGNLRPSSVASTPEFSTIGKPKPPPPIGKKPPIPPPSSRKPSSTPSAPSVPSAPPPPPSSAPAPPSAPPLPPAASAPKPPPAPAARPPPPAPSASSTSQTNGNLSLAEQAARSAFRTTSPAAPPPPPPPAPAQSPPESPGERVPSGAPPPPPPPPPANLPSRPSTAGLPPPPPPPPAAQQRQSSFTGSAAPPPPAPPPPPSKTTTNSTAGGIPTAGGLTLGATPTNTSLNSQQTPLSQLKTLDASSYTLTNGSSVPTRTDSAATGRPGSRGPALYMEDSKFKFQRDDQLPKPRDFTGGPKRYRAGRGSSVPIDLAAFE